jgi:hypothetical protein
MRRFRYRAVAASGELVHGEMAAASQATVIERLRGQGHLSLAADEVAAGSAAPRRLTLVQRLRRPVPKRAAPGCFGMHPLSSKISGVPTRRRRSWRQGPAAKTRWPAAHSAQRGRTAGGPWPGRRASG